MGQGYCISLRAGGWGGYEFLYVDEEAYRWVRERYGDQPTVWYISDGPRSGLLRLLHGYPESEDSGFTVRCVTIPWSGSEHGTVWSRSMACELEDAFDRARAALPRDWNFKEFKLAANGWQVYAGHQYLSGAYVEGAVAGTLTKALNRLADRLEGRHAQSAK